VRREGAGPQRGYTRPGTGSLHPVAIRAAVEATRLLKPLVQRVARRLGERAGRNVSERRAGPENVMQEPTRHGSREGRSEWNRTSEQVPSDLPGYWRRHAGKVDHTQHGKSQR
jgi:hypothetical protein